MGREEWRNREAVGKLEAELKTVFPRAKLGKFSLDRGNGVIAAGLSIRMKGNADKIKKLKEMGWQQEQVEAPTNQYGHKVYYVTMMKRV